MKTKLIKQNGIGIQTLDGSDYFLIIDGKTYHTNPLTAGLIDGGKLSYKNCQAIERGYDLDELAEKKYPILNLPLTDTTAMNSLKQDSFREGFQKALELMGDKKFSEEDMINFSEFVSGKYINQYKFLRDKSLKGFFSTDEILKEYQSLQQKEWDVEVVTEPMNLDEIREQGKGFLNSITNKPKLDADGCLILKGI